MNFKVLWLFAKVFSAKFGGRDFFCDTSGHFGKVFFHESFPLYGTARSKAVDHHHGTLHLIFCLLNLLLCQMVLT